MQLFIERSIRGCELAVLAICSRFSSEEAGGGRHACSQRWQKSRRQMKSKQTLRYAKWRGVARRARRAVKLVRNFYAATVLVGDLIKSICQSRPLEKPRPSLGDLLCGTLFE